MPDLDMSGIWRVSLCPPQRTGSCTRYGVGSTVRLLAGTASKHDVGAVGTVTGISTSLGRTIAWVENDDRVYGWFDMSDLEATDA